ncbi:MAG: hypothetical protein JRF42_08675 [Deltaproteobacteria bacterium]|nr:hypothetical protein [Deltaproteobacteria bacterium]
MLRFRRLVRPAITFDEVHDAHEVALARELIRTHAHHRLIAETSRVRRRKQKGAEWPLIALSTAKRARRTGGSYCCAGLEVSPPGRHAASVMKRSAGSASE